MNAVVGESSRRKLFGVIDLVGPLTAGRAVFLASLGIAIVLLEQAFRWPLQLPGHHGLEAMALLVWEQGERDAEITTLRIWHPRTLRASRSSTRKSA